jgi:energy-coupling factor transport system permease protein
MRLSPVPAVLCLACAAAAALLADELWSAGAIAAVLLAVVLQAPRRRRHLYLVAALTSGLGVFLLSPLFAVEGVDVLWSGPTLPVLGPIDVTAEELRIAALNALRLTAVTLAFSAYALLLDHDRLLSSVGLIRRSALAAALATRLLPTLERDASGLVDAVRGRGISVEGVRGRARLVSPLVAGSLERALCLAEAMEARGFGRPGRTQVPRLPWSLLDKAAVMGTALLVVGAALWA